jgi:Zn-dependent protease
MVAGFGWAKPVHFNEENLRNPKTDVMKIAIAGPLSNALSAMILSLVLASSTEPALMASYNKTVLIIINVLRYAIYINWGLFVFNLIPLPPLDGSHLLFYPFRKYPSVYEAIYKYGSLLLFGLIIFSIISKTNLIPIGKIMEYLYYGFLNLIGYR